MQLENTFTVPTGIDDAWVAFNDPTRFAPCFPGATVESYEGDSFVGTVKVKLGPISLTYKGTGTYLQRDDANYSVLIDATGRDARGNGTASAKVTGSLTSLGADETEVKMITDLTVTGRPAQFGRGVMADVSDKIINQFAACLAKKLGPEGAAGGAPGAAAAPAEAASGGAASGGAAAAPAGSPVGTVAPAGSASANGVGPKLASVPEPAGEVEALDLLGTTGGPLLKRAVPAFLALVLLFVVIRRLKNR
jgi:carbon monoxide dehydrogenase subunit G